MAALPFPFCRSKKSLWPTNRFPLLRTMLFLPVPRRSARNTGSTFSARGIARTRRTNERARRWRRWHSWVSASWAIPMARHLKAKGPRGDGLQPHRAKAEKWVARERRQGRHAPAPGGRGAQDIVFSCVGNDDDLRQVTLGTDGRIRRHEEGRRLRRPHHRLGAVARELHAGREGEAGFGFVDAPVSGGQAGAENGASP